MKAGTTPCRMTHMMKCVVRTLLAIVLVLSSVPLVPKRAAAEDVSLDARIQSMLDGGGYVDGEAIVIVRSHAQVETSPVTEDLAEVDANTLRATAEDAKRTENATGEEVALRAQSIQGDSFEVKLVVDHGRSTEQLLRDLYADPDVISAEPNYTASAEAFGDEELWPDEGAAGQGAASKPAASPLTESPLAEDSAPTAPATDGLLSAQSEPAAAGLQTQATSPRDLTPLQWYADKGLSTNDSANTPISPTAGYSLNVPGWLEGRTNQNAPANASGTVCIMDTGIDATHPDLSGLLYKFSPEEQQKYGCGEYGYNVSGDGLGTNYLRASDNHGTHLAGIIAAEWNDQDQNQPLCVQICRQSRFVPAVLDK